MRDVIDQFDVNDEDVYIADDVEDLEYYAENRTAIQPIGRRLDPDNPETATWNPQVEKKLLVDAVDVWCDNQLISTATSVEEAYAYVLRVLPAMKRSGLGLADFSIQGNGEHLSGSDLVERYNTEDTTRFPKPQDNEQEALADLAHRRSTGTD